MMLLSISFLFSISFSQLICTTDQWFFLSPMWHLFQMYTYGEVSRSFVMQWNDMLERYCHLVDKDGNMYTVVYNQDLQSPTIVSGWTALRDFYQLTGDHQVSIMVKVYSCLPYSKPTVIQNHSQNGTHYTIKCRIRWLSLCFSINIKLLVATW